MERPQVAHVHWILVHVDLTDSNKLLRCRDFAKNSIEVKTLEMLCLMSKSVDLRQDSKTQV